MAMESAHITRGESLWERLDVLRDSGSHGAKTCLAMSSFLKERAQLENAYGEVIRVQYTAAVLIVPPYGRTHEYSVADLCVGMEGNERRRYTRRRSVDALP